MDIHTINANGLEIAFLQWGDAGPLVIMVHGFPDTAYSWDVVGPRVAEQGYRVVAPFTRGIAPSQIPADGIYDGDTLGRDVLGLIEALGEEKAIIVGHDFGAVAVYSAAGQAPDKIDKLITVAIPHPAAIKPNLRIAWGARHFFFHRLPGAAGRFAKNDYAQLRVLYERWSPGFDWPDSEFDEAKKAYRQPGCCQAALTYYKFLSPTVPAGIRKRHEVPTLIVGGVTDGVCIEADFRASTTRFNGRCEVVMVPGGHFLHREHPEPFIAALLAFIQS